MRQLTRLVLVPALAALLVAGIYGVGHVQGNRAAMFARPTAVAAVNLKMVFEGLDELSAANRDLESLGDILEAERAALEQEVETIKGDLEFLTPGSDQHTETLDALALASLRLQGHVEYSLQRLDAARSDLRRTLFTSVETAVQSFAEENGWDMVVVSDASFELQPGTESAVRQQIAAKRVMYALPSVDISDDLVNWMNARFKARASATGTTP